MSKVTFFSNYINHHQLPFSKEMVKLTDNNYFFVAQKAISEKRIALGYKNISNDYDFVVKTYENESELKKAYELAETSDYVIFGGNTQEDKYVIDRIKNNKITFEYSERLNKRKLSLYMYIKKYLNMMVYRGIYKKKQLYLLCSGGYVANDFKMFNMYQNKTYKWGYFPECIDYDIDELMNKKNNDVVNILWAGRLIDWKHPEQAIKVACKLKEENIKFNLNIIGQGDMGEEIQKQIVDNNLSDCVNMLGSMPPEEVRKHMEQANILLFTSDYQEGWGAVLNEAMNSGCVCIASHAIGSASFLIKHNQNGLIYRNEDFEDLYKQVKSVINNKDKQKELGINAYKTIKETWNAKVAAERFLVLAKELENGNDTPYTEGPCSKAFPIKDEDMYASLVK
ncbi:MAG: glycosyltransferase [Erysipelotrichaceae bacterium]|nr:glycosyltransferase [Erysipelotrichaceae bacterium]